MKKYEYGEMRPEWKVLMEKVGAEIFSQEDLDRFNDKGGHDWHSLIFGWAIANGLGPEEADDFSWCANRITFEFNK